MSDINTSELPLEIRAKLAELELELSEGDITEKGYWKKKTKLLEPYSESSSLGQVDTQLCDRTNVSSAVSGETSAGGQSSRGSRRKDGRRYTRDEVRYRSDIREEAVKEALARSKAQRHESFLMPNKRRDASQATDPPNAIREQQLVEQDTDSDEDEDDLGGNATSSGSSSRRSTDARITLTSAGAVDGSPVPAPRHASQVVEGNIFAAVPSSSSRNEVSSGATHEYQQYGPCNSSDQVPSTAVRSQPHPHHPTERDSSAAVGSPQRSDSSASGDGHRRGAFGAPPDVTHNTSALRRANILQSTGQLPPSPLAATNASGFIECTKSSDSRDIMQTGSAIGASGISAILGSTGSLRSSNDQMEDSGVATRVSEKILALVHTLKRPKRRPLPDYFLDEEDDQVPTPISDPNAPQAKGELIKPAQGEELLVPSGLPLNLESALQRYASVGAKSNVLTCLDANARPTITLSYGKLYQRALRIAYLLLNKLGHRGEASLKPGDRVALVFPNNDAINFMCSFYGCIFAGVVPLAVEVPLMKRDASCQSMGFLLSSEDIRVVLTSETCYKALPRAQSGEIMSFAGWPKVQWIVTDHHSSGKPSRDWQQPERPKDAETCYTEYTYGKDGSVRGVMVSRRAMLSHCRALTTACHYSEEDALVCVVDCKREAGLWHAVLSSVFNGMHVIFVPYAIMKVDPGSWLRMVTKYKATAAIVKSRDMHWALLAEKDHPSINLSSLKMLLIADGANPWSLTSCDSFLAKFRCRGLRPDAVCPCASSCETLTLSLRRPAPPADHPGGNVSTTGGTGGGRGVLSMQSLSHSVVRVDSENSLTSLTLQDCGQVLPGGTAVVVKPMGAPYLCKTDEVGEICLSSNYTGNGYWGLQGQTNFYFRVQPLQPDGSVYAGTQMYTRSGLLGFLGPVSSGGLIFICGSVEGMMNISGRRHNADDLIATVLAVEPMKIVYRGRIAVFSTTILKDERIVMVAELRQGFNEEACFKWMSRVLQAIDSIHQVNVYCLALVHQNYLPKTPLGGIHVHETLRRFLEGSLHPCNVLLCPHTAVTNLPQPRELRPGLVGPSAMMVGNLVQGARLAWAQGRELPPEEEGAKHQFLSDILQWRASHTPDERLFTVINQKMQESATLTCLQLHRKAEKIGSMLLEKGKVAPGAHVAIMYPAGIDLVCAVYGCLYAGCVPVPLKPPHTDNLDTTLETALMVVQSSRSAVVLTLSSILKILKSKDAQQRVHLSKWPTIVDTDESYRKKLASLYRAMSADQELAYLDFAVSTTGVLTGIRMTHATTSALCHSQKVQCEFYPTRAVLLCLEPYSGLGFALWCLTSVYCGHHSILVPPQEMETAPWLWLTACGQRKVRDTFCSYAAIELSSKALPNEIPNMKQKGVSLSSIRSLVIVAEERPRIQLTNSFTKLFAVLGLNTRAVSTSFGCRANVTICLQGASSPDTTTVYVDTSSLRNDRVKLLEKGSPHSLCLLESGKLLPGVRVVIANPETMGQCADSHLGEIWVASPHSAAGYFIVYGSEEQRESHADNFRVRLATGDTETTYARTGYLGFVRRTDLTQSDGERHDALYVVGALEEAIMLRGMRYHPIDIENTILRSHKKVSECAVFTWSNLLVAVVELDGLEWEAMDLVPPVTSAVLEDHYLIVGVVVVADLGTVPINSRGKKQRMLLRDTFVNDKLDPIYVSYNM